MDVLESASFITACRNVILQHERKHESNIMLMRSGIKVDFSYEMELNARAIMAKKTIDAFEEAEYDLLAKIVWEVHNLPMGTLVIE